MKIYTKNGDNGKSQLVDGTQVPKNHHRLDAYGTTDELNSHIGLLRSLINEAGDEQLSALSPVFDKIQNELFNVGSQLACSDKELREKLPQISDKTTEALESAIDKMEAELPALKNFILPGGSMISSQGHICRTVCRRAERLCCQLELPESQLAIPFLNRLSDFFFVFARFGNLRLRHNEVTWSS